MTSVSQSIPQEIFDLFVDAIGLSGDKFDSEYRRILQTFSLVSRRFRRRAQHYLLSDISLIKTRYDDNAVIIRRIKMLKSILASGFGKKTNAFDHDRLACRIRSFKVVLQGSLVDVYAVLNLALASILKMLNGTTYGLRTFGIIINEPYMEMSWAKVKPGFRKEFAKMLASPFLTSLHLRNIVDLPTSLLHGTYIRYIDFSFLRFVDTSANVSTLYTKLEKIHIDPSFSILRLLSPDTGNDQATPTFDSNMSYLRELKYAAPITHDFQKYFQPITAVFNNIETLKLEFLEIPNQRVGVMTWNIPYSKLSTLKSLTITLKGYKFAKDLDLLLKALVDLLQPRNSSKSLERLQLEISVRSPYPWRLKKHFFPHIEQWLVLDNVLNHANLISVVDIDLKLFYHIMGPQLFAFNEDIFKTKCQLFIDSAYPSTMSPTSGKKLNVSVSPCFW